MSYFDNFELFRALFLARNAQSTALHIAPDCTMAEESSFVIQGPDGRPVNIATRRGADAFIGDGKEPFIETVLEQMTKPLRMLLSTVFGPERQAFGLQLLTGYAIFQCMAEYPSPEVLERVPESQLSLLVDHFTDVFGTLTRSPRWMLTGVLEDWDRELLHSFVGWSRHPAAVRVMLKGAFLPTLAAMLEACGKLPSSPVCENVFAILYNLWTTMEDMGMAAEAIFKRFVKDGIMSQYLRCLAQPQLDPEVLQRQRVMVACLQQQSVLLLKYFNNDTEVGDMLSSLLAQGPSSMQSVAYAFLSNLANVAKMVDDHWSKPSVYRCNLCRRTGRSGTDAQTALLVCSRCKSVSYCSKECQRADWKAHKRTCEPKTANLAELADAESEMLRSFSLRHYCAIMKEIRVQMERRGVDKGELILEVNFFSQHGTAPAMMDPPQFKIGVTKCYFEGDRPEEPDWFRKGSRDYEQNATPVIAYIEEVYGLLTDDRLLVVAYYPSGRYGVQTLRVESKDSGAPIFSTRALEVVAAALDNNEHDEELESVLGSSLARQIVMGRG